MTCAVANESIVVVGLSTAEINYLAKRITHSARDGRLFVSFLSQAPKIARVLTQYRRRHRCKTKAGAR